jgi:DNA-binding MarR family transcriptional regulator
VKKDSRLDAWLIIGRARHFMLELRQKELEPYHISPQQLFVLEIISEIGAKATLPELAKRLERKNNTVSLQMTRMEKDGLVKKVHDARKSSMVRYELTEKGTDTYNKARERSTIKKIMSILTEAERQELIGMMEKLVKAVKKY